MIGIDIVENKRINLKITEKILNKKEIKQLNNITDHNAKIQYVASRFAAKEAFTKASQIFINFQEIAILRQPNSSPLIEIPTKYNLDIEKIEISISHEQNYSVALCIIKN